MKIKILRNIGRRRDLTEGQQVDLPDGDAMHLVKQGLAEMLEPVKAVPPSQPAKAEPMTKPVEGSVEKAEEDLKTYAEKSKKSASK